MKIKALRTIAGSYGVLHEGKEAIVKDGLGKELIDAGLAEQVSDEQPEPEPKEDAKAAPKSSVKINGKLK